MILCAVPAAARRAQRGGEGEKTWKNRAWSEKSLVCVMKALDLRESVEWLPCLNSLRLQPPRSPHFSSSCLNAAWQKSSVCNKTLPPPKHLSLSHTHNQNRPKRDDAERNPNSPVAGRRSFSYLWAAYWFDCPGRDTSTLLWILGINHSFVGSGISILLLSLRIPKFYLPKIFGLVWKLPLICLMLCNPHTNLSISLLFIK